MDCPRTPWGWLEKLLGNTMYPCAWTVRAPHGGRWPWGEMAGKCIHGYPWTVHSTPCGEMAGKVTREYKLSIHGYPWTVRAPHGGR